MRIPLFIAHGELLIPIIFIGLPSLVLCITFLVLAIVEEYSQKDPKQRWRKWLFGILGFGFLLTTVLSPRMLHLVDWVFERVNRIIIG